MKTMRRRISDPRLAMLLCLTAGLTWQADAHAQPAPDPAASVQPPAQASEQAPELTPMLPPVLFEARDRRTHYFVGVEAGAACQTPCSLALPMGPNTLVIGGPGSRLFRRQVVIPNLPVKVQLSHLTLGRIIAGAILSAVSLPLNFFGALLAFSENDPASLPIGVPMLVTGLACTVTGIALLATLRTNSARVKALEPTVQFTGAGIGMTPDRRGALAAVTLSY
jgi:hypothetical protein